MGFLAQLEKSQTFSHFGVELSPEVKNILNVGGKLNAFFTQEALMIVPEEIQFLMVGMIWLGMFGNVSEKRIPSFRARLVKAFKDNAEFNTSVKSMVNVSIFKDLLSGVQNKQQELMAICQQEEDRG